MKNLAAYFAFFVWLSVQSASAFDQSHALLSTDLKRYVERGLVHYARWQHDRSNLEKYLDSVAKLKPDELKGMSRLQKEALWLNVYNAFTIKLVLDHYPIHGKSSFYPANSLRQIPDVWEKYSTLVAGQPYSIETIEHSVLRRDFRDERIHFAQNAAARGSGKLRQSAFVADTLDADLNELTDRFLQDKRNVVFDFAKKTVSVSYIFDWFPLDFTRAAGFCKRKFPPPPDDDIVLSYLSKHFAALIGKHLKDASQFMSFKVVYLPFDWSLNDADAPSEANASRPSGGAFLSNVQLPGDAVGACDESIR